MALGLWRGVARERERVSEREREDGGRRATERATEDVEELETDDE